MNVDGGMELSQRETIPGRIEKIRQNKKVKCKPLRQESLSSMSKDSSVFLEPKVILEGMERGGEGRGKEGRGGKRH
jgi:hypothetical protein